MDLKQLEYFVRVAELGSFTRAAQALDIAQPALSRQVRLLEVELRQTLLVRNGRGATPTEAGTLLLEHGRGILHQVTRLREELSRARGGLAGHVALGLPPSVARVLTVPFTRAFRQRFPQARVSISEGLTVGLQESLLTGHADIAVLYNPAPLQGVETDFLAEEELVFVQARPPGLQEDPPPPAISLREVADMPLVIPRQPNAIRKLVEADMVACGCQPSIALEIDGVAAILDLVEDGAGCAVLSRHAVQRSGKPSAFSVRPIVRPDGSALKIRLYAALSALRPATQLQQQTLELLREITQALLAG
ncbi:MAG: LysR substrate-binding domain-containing protein [Rhodocyclaceae bacterium]